jgi:hypothetical protein
LQWRGLPGRTNHFTFDQVNGEVVFGEPATGRGRGLHLAPALGASGLQLLQQLPGAVCGIAVDGQRIIAIGGRSVRDGRVLGSVLGHVLCRGLGGGIG